VHSLNSNPRVSMAMSVGGSNTFQIGNAITQYQISPYGGVGLDYYSDGTQWNDPPSTFIRRVMAQSYSNLFTAGYRDVFQRALEQARRCRAPSPWRRCRRCSRIPTSGGNSGWWRD
jgi:hypothetical protein